MCPADTCGRTGATELVELVEVPTVAHRCVSGPWSSLTKSSGDPAEYQAHGCARTHHRTVTRDATNRTSHPAARTRAASVMKSLTGARVHPNESHLVVDAEGHAPLTRTVLALIGVAAMVCDLRM